MKSQDETRKWVTACRRRSLTCVFVVRHDAAMTSLRREIQDVVTRYYESSRDGSRRCNSKMCLDCLLGESGGGRADARVRTGLDVDVVNKE